MNLIEMEHLMTRTRIQILPMSNKKEFKNWTPERLQDEFFGDRMNEREEITEKIFYNYEGTKIALPDGEKALILFQFESSIVACGVLERVIEDEYEKKGRYFFSEGTIKTFAPISEEKIKKIYNTFKKFGNVKTILDSGKLDEEKLKKLWILMEKRK
ncbi:MAG: hypothetical protein WBG30_15230 [Psychrilyobacter sp.]|uniref:hypothetical protein n=1 Tax=Psychrilyobacter sp. TaxID=2586924 RepID=UPI003C78C2E3